MPTVQQKEADALLVSLTPVLHAFLTTAARSNGDFHAVEEAGARAIQQARRLMMTSGLRVSSECADRAFHCPACRVPLHVWERRDRKVETCEGEAVYAAVRYRCPKCSVFHAPLEEANGLAHSQFTTMAQGLIGETAAQFAYAPATAVLSKRSVRVSAKEVDRMARDVASWRRDEEQAVVADTFDKREDEAEAAPVQMPPKLFDWRGWGSGSPVMVSADGAMVRSPDRGPDGLEWFEVRAAVIAPVEENSHAQKVCLGGFASPDELFDRLSGAWRQGPYKGRLVVFVADGALWIWDRVRLYFAGCIQVLDIYHAGEHLASAAAALWGEGSEKHKQWRRDAREELLAKDGARNVLRVLLEGLRCGQASDEKVLRKEIAYLWRHRHRMRYHWLKQRGLPIGSGAMESTIKQVTTARLRQAGMKWTRQGADAMITLRAAHLSGELQPTALRRHHALLARIDRYRPTVLQCAA